MSYKRVLVPLMTPTSSMMLVQILWATLVNTTRVSWLCQTWASWESATCGTRQSKASRSLIRQLVTTVRWKKSQLVRIVWMATGK